MFGNSSQVCTFVFWAIIEMLSQNIIACSFSSYSRLQYQIKWRSESIKCSIWLLHRSSVVFMSYIRLMSGKMILLLTVIVVIYRSFCTTFMVFMTCQLIWQDYVGYYYEKSYCHGDGNCSHLLASLCFIEVDSILAKGLKVSQIVRGTCARSGLTIFHVAEHLKRQGNEESSCQKNYECNHGETSRY